jgi:hypothetical protein
LLICEISAIKRRCFIFAGGLKYAIIDFENGVFAGILAKSAGDAPDQQAGQNS